MSSSPSSSVRIKPSPGFVVKSAVLQAATYQPENGTAIHVPQGLKIFVNVAWAAEAPPPPDGLCDAIDKVLQSDAQLNGNTSTVPVVASNGRSVTDKAGKPALVFDVVFHRSLKSPTLTNPNAKLYLIETALRTIEEQAGFSLSRTIGTPNIASKGAIPPLTIPPLPNPSGNDYKHSSLDIISSKKPLVEEIVDISAVKGDPSSAKTTNEEYPQWSWNLEGERLRVEIRVLKLTRELISAATVDVESRRLLFRVPNLYNLDVDLSLSDTALQTRLALSGAGPDGVERALMLKRVRPLDTDGATAEWQVGKGRLIVYV